VKECKHTQVHDVVTADGTVVDNDIPGPESDSVPLRQTYQSLLLRSNQTRNSTFLTSKRFFPESAAVSALEVLVLGGASVISTSAMLTYKVCGRGTTG
jgi:hypothetical protein